MHQSIEANYIFSFPDDGRLKIFRIWVFLIKAVEVTLRCWRRYHALHCHLRLLCAQMLV